MSNSGAQESDPSFGDQLKCWIKNNYKSVKAFCRESGLKYYSTQNWITGHRSPSTDALIELEALGFNAFAAAGKQGVSIAKYKASSASEVADNYAEELIDIESRFRFIKVLDIEASAGAGNLVYSEDSDTDFAFNSMYLRRKGLLNAKLSVVRIKGNSMEDHLSDGEFVLVHHDVPPVEGKICLLRKGSEIFIKRMRMTKAGWLALSDNPIYPPIDLDEDDAVIGMAVSAMRDL